MKKAFDQTVRDIKREVNKKVLKVPSIEQKVLDSTSNEPWGPHGSLLALIAQASRNYHEYQMIMAVLWKRLNDTGKNWRHVYKALTVLEYLVAHGSERVIDEIREHSYQISTLSDFQYIDSSGKDQGNNVRKKSQNLVVLVNDKERIIEVRQKAAANKDKFRTSPGGMYRPGSYSSTGGYDDDGRYKDEDRNGYGYGKEREYNYRDEDRYGKYGDSYGRDADRYGEERYGRDGYRDDDYRERSRSIDGYGSRSRSSDRDRDRAFDDDGQSSSRGSGARADDQAHDGRRLERKPSEQNIGGPPSYEETISESRSPAHSERNGEILAAPAPGASSPPAPRTSPPSNPGQANTSDVRSPSPEGQETEVFDEFDPRGPVSAAPTATSVPTAHAFPTTSNNAEMDLLGSLSDVFAPNPLAIVPITSATASSEADSQANFSGSTFAATQSASNVMNQAFEDPFGDNPFKATPTDNFSAQQPTASATPFQPTMNQNAEMAHAAAPPNGDAFSGMTYSAPDVQPPSTNSHFLPQEISSSHPETDILADILPPSGPAAVASQAGFSFPSGQPPQPGTSMYGNFNSPAGNMVPLTAPHMAPQTQQLSSPNFLPQGGFPATNPSNMALQPPAGPVAQFNNGNFPQQGFTAPVVSQFSHHTPTGSTPQFNSGNFLPQQGSTVPVSSQFTYQTPTASSPQQNDVLGNLFSQGSKSSPQAALPSSAGSLAIVPQPSKDKFETKSTVWADTLSRGLVNLNISGTKTNPLADIGIDFDALNRKEKRMEKQPMTPVISTVTMGKAMGSGTGMGRAGAGALRPPSPNPMIGSGMGMGVGGGMNMGIGMGGRPGSGLGMGGYGVVHQPMGGVGMGTGMNAGMNMGMMQGGQMPPPGSAMPGGYNPMMGSGGYTPQQPYGGGYR